MKVKYKDQELNNDSFPSKIWLNDQRVYDVLTILIAIDHSVQFRIISEHDRIPIIVDSKKFKIESLDVPSNWIIRIFPDGFIKLGPPELLEPGFWELYFEKDRESIMKLNKIIKEL